MNLDSARPSQIEASRSEREGPAPCAQGDEEDRFGKVAASPNSQNLTEPVYVDYRFSRAPDKSSAGL